MSAAGAELVEGVPQLAAAGLGRPQRGVELLELRARAGPGGDHQRVLDAGAAGERDADDVDVDGERLGPRPARRRRPGSGRRRRGRTSRRRRTAARRPSVVSTGNPTSSSGNRTTRHERQREEQQGVAELVEHVATPACGRARRGRRAGARTGRRRAGRPGGATAGARRPRRPAAARRRRVARPARRPGSAAGGPAGRGPGDEPHPGAQGAGEDGGPDHRATAVVVAGHAQQPLRVRRARQDDHRPDRAADQPGDGEQHELPGERCRTAPCSRGW